MVHAFSAGLRAEIMYTTRYPVELVELRGRYDLGKGLKLICLKLGYYVSEIEMVRSGVKLDRNSHGHRISCHFPNVL